MKSLLHVLMALMLSISIVAPAVLDIVTIDQALEFAENLGDEDSKKESKKDIEEKEFFYEELSSASLVALLDATAPEHYSFSPPYLLATDIHVPPPEL